MVAWLAGYTPLQVGFGFAGLCVGALVLVIAYKLSRCGTF